MTHSLLILAAREEMHRVWGRFDHGDPTLSISHLLLGMGIIVAGALLLVARRAMARRALRTFAPARPAKLFRELCAEHGLTLAARRLLKQVAAEQGVNNPAFLFVEPKYFNEHDLPAELQASSVEIRQLREVLFD